MTTISDPKNLGEALSVARKQLWLTQAQLALAAGVGVRFVVELEAGKPTVQLERTLQCIGGECAGAVTFLGPGQSPSASSNNVEWLSNDVSQRP